MHQYAHKHIDVYVCRKTQKYKFGCVKSKKPSEKQRNTAMEKPQFGGTVAKTFGETALDVIRCETRREKSQSGSEFAKTLGEAALDVI